MDGIGGGGGGGRGDSYRRRGRSDLDEHRNDANDDDGENHHQVHSLRPILPDPGLSRRGVGEHCSEWDDGDRPDRRRDDCYHDDDVGRKSRSARKRRVRHDLPGPAGTWFRRRRQKTATHASAKDDATTSSTAACGEGGVEASRRGGEDDGSMARGRRNLAVVVPFSIAPSGEAADGIIIGGGGDVDADSPPDRSGGARKGVGGRGSSHDHDLHECDAWNMMCAALDRVVPARADDDACGGGGGGRRDAAYGAYKDVVRRNVAVDYALLHEIHEGKYDVVDRIRDGDDDDDDDGGESLSSPDGELRLPLLVGYVAGVRCHPHSDWTAVLVDESGVGGGGRGGVVCWIEERLVKKHPNWMRPGCVWMIEGARLALFASDACDQYDDHDKDDDGIDNDEGDGTVTRTRTDVSPSTDNARAGGNIDRMILVGEYCLAYAWTPEEATSAFAHNEYVRLTERRFNVGFPEKAEEKRAIEAIDEGEGIDDGDDPMAIGVTGGPNATEDRAAKCIIDRSSLEVKPTNPSNVGTLKGRAIISDDSKSDKLTLPPASSNDVRTADGGVAVGVDLLVRSRIEARKSPSSTDATDVYRTHREDHAAQPNPSMAAVSLPTLRGADVECDDEELMFNEKISEIGAESPAAPSIYLDVTRLREQEGKPTHAEDNRDDVGKFQIASTREAPPPTREKGPKNKPRPVSCETAASSPCHDIMDDSRCQHSETINNSEHRSSNCNAPSQPKSIDSFDDIPDEELLELDPTTGNRSYSTPKESNNKKCLPRLRIDTGDSFDDMLDEDDDVSCAGIGKEDRKPEARVHLLQSSECEMNTPLNYVAPSVATRKASLFDSLNGDDLDFLSEDE